SMRGEFARFGAGTDLVLYGAIGPFRKLYPLRYSSPPNVSPRLVRVAAVGCGVGPLGGTSCANSEDPISKLPVRTAPTRIRQTLVLFPVKHNTRMCDLQFALEMN